MRPGWKFKKVTRMVKDKNNRIWTHFANRLPKYSDTHQNNPHICWEVDRWLDYTTLTNMRFFYILCVCVCVCVCVCGVFEHIKRHIWFKKSCPGKQLNKILTAVIMNVRVMMMLHVPASSFCSRITIFKNKFLFKINFFYVFESFWYIDI